MGVFMGGYILKRLQLRPKGAVQLILIFQMISLAMYSVLFVVGCDNVKMAGATAPYSLRYAAGVPPKRPPPSASAWSGALGGARLSLSIDAARY